MGPSEPENTLPRRRKREAYARVEGLLRALERIVSRVPLRVRRLLLEGARNLPTVAGIGVRYALLRTIARDVGQVVAIFEGVYLREAENLLMGSNVSIHPMCYLDATGGISIGDDVSLAHGVTIMSTEHDYTREGVNIRDAPLIHAPVSIGNDVWVGAGVKILAGVTVGNHVVIGAGAVVTTDIPSNAVAVGVPARVVRSMDASGAT